MAGEWLWRACHVFPGTKWLVFRKTRVSLNESFLDTWENEVLGPDHPVVVNGPKRPHRTSYDFANGSRVVLGGMDNPTRLFSTQYNGAFCNEAVELQLHEWESIHRSLRRPGTPWHILWGDTNPSDKWHWLNQRCFERICDNLDCETDQVDPALKLCPECGSVVVPRTQRLTSQHADNPTVTKDYLVRLRSSLTGVRRLRLYHGIWVSAEGLIWPTFNEGRHVITAEHEYNESSKRHFLHILDGFNVETGQEHRRVVELTWFLASQDVGFDAPGVFQVWGFDRDGAMYRVAEVYRTGWDADEWATVIAELYQTFPFKAMVCDHDPAFIKTINRRLSGSCGRDLGGLCRPADKTPGKSGELAGIDQVRVRLRNDQLFFVRDAFPFGTDSRLREKSQPLCTEQEVGAYVFRLPANPGADGRPKPIPDEPDPGCVDHGCDATRYAARWGFLKNLGAKESLPPSDPSSIDAMFPGLAKKHAQLDKLKRRAREAKRRAERRSR